ncbi:MAG: protease inhibitor I42 family protein [Akkermansia sp.]|nr:protease inhibitor I42 family protein [Akkermansia sp.]
MMKNILLVAVPFLLLGLAFVSCADMQSAPEQPAQPAAPQGDDITLKVGESAVRVLDGNPTTGYVWTAQELPADSAVKVTTRIMPAEATKEPVCGSPSPTEVTITAVRPGTATVKLVYARPWEKDEAPWKTKEYRITVQPAE